MRYFQLYLLCIFLFSCQSKSDDLLSPTDKNIPNTIDGIVYETGNWAHPEYNNAFEFEGNHRFVIHTSADAKIVEVLIPWRRRDNNPAEKSVMIIDVQSGKEIQNKFIAEIDNEKGHIFFEPFPGSEVYHVYYLPQKSTGSYYPKLHYVSPQELIDSTWIKQLNETVLSQADEAKVISAQSIDDFHSFFPMEIIATQEEVDQFLSTHPRSYYLFPEYRNFSIRMKDFLPKHWMDRRWKTGLQDTVSKGEFYTFQIGLYAPEKQLSNVQVEFSDLQGRFGKSIPKNAISCFNTTGTDLNGQAFQKKLQVSKGKVQALWFGVDIPENQPKGLYRGTVKIHPKGLPTDSIWITLEVGNQTIANHGDDRPENMSRLRWLNSTIGADPDFIQPPFTPVEINDHLLKILGRDIEVGPDGLPKAIHSYFPSEMTFLKDQSAPILSAPINFQVEAQDGKKEEWETQDFAITQSTKGRASWYTVNKSSSFKLDVKGELEYDGMLQYKLALIAKKDINLKNIILQIPLHPSAAKYMLGLGKKGGKRPNQVSWKWDITRHQEGVWLGGVNKGLQYVLRDQNYERPLNTNFYQDKPLNLPPSWYNKGKGGIDLRTENQSVIANNYSGPRAMATGDTLHFHIRFLITPFKLLHTPTHFQTRFVHKYVPVDSADAWGGTVINVHHANEINPYINYPFFNLEAQKAYIDAAHQKGIKVKLYNTIREVTYKMHELFALRSLGDEIFNDGEGGGHGWLQEHLKEEYYAAWHASRVNDAAILNKGTSRWTNYYIEGLNWLAKNQEIDGLYLDDIAFSRETVKRISNVLHTNRPEVVIDLHSANQFNPRDGFTNSAFLYMEHFPYISRLWFGEYFEYDLAPDYWLTEVSGIPFGLMGEMLEKGGHPYRGMVYGITTRIYGTYDPSPLWHLFDDFDIVNSEMLGYWVDRNPIKVNHPDIRCTVYRHNDKVLIALGSWSVQDENVLLNIDWKALGMDLEGTQLSSPAIEGLQPEQEWVIGQPVVVEKNKGLMLILKNK